MEMAERSAEAGPHQLDSAELGLLAHIYRGEVYRSTIWRTRLDQTTNWAVVTTGLALSLTFAGPGASPLPLILVGLLVIVFLLFEARRYRYFNVWRARCRVLETDVCGPLLRGEGVRLDGHWNRLLANDYQRPEFHISYMRAIGRRIRRNYGYILAVQAVAYYGKLAIHPISVPNWDVFLIRAAIGPISGLAVVIAGLVFHGIWVVIAIVTLIQDRRAWRSRKAAAIG
jgi:uncharacterized membrane protein